MRIIFVSGLGGTGKSSLVDYFNNHPLEGFSFFDFDLGGFKAPSYDMDHLEWRTKQSRYWINQAVKEHKVKGDIPVIVGLCLYPRQMRELSKEVMGKGELSFCHVVCDAEERKRRLVERGTPHHWQGEKPWYKEFYKEMKESAVYEIDTTKMSIKETAMELMKWLMK